VPIVRLTEVFRQAAASRIIANAHRINRGGMPNWARDPDSDFHFVLHFVLAAMPKTRPPRSSQS
jgi:hypothetical protein